MLHYASHIIHLIAQPAPSPDPIARLLAYDALLHAIAHDPLIWGCHLGESLAPIEDYLQIRPAAYEALAQYAYDNRLEFGPWYVPHHPEHSIELTLRNLLYGMESLRLLKMPLGVAPLPAEFNPQIPQILRGFGLEAGLIAEPDQPLTPHLISGLDGSRMTLLAPQSQKENDQAVNGRHRGQILRGSPSDWLAGLEKLRAERPQDEIFFSSPSALAKASALNIPSDAEYQALPALPIPIPDILLHQLERRLRYDLEPRLAWSDAPARPEISEMNDLRRYFWRSLLRLNAAESENERTYLAERLSAELDSLESHLAVPQVKISDYFEIHADVSRAFQVLALKPPEDGRGGLILRGYNASPAAYMLSLRPLRNFSACEVLRHDETPLGASLPIHEGAIQFMANPQRLITLWLH